MRAGDKGTGERKCEEEGGGGEGISNHRLLFFIPYSDDLGVNWGYTLCDLSPRLLPQSVAAVWRPARALQLALAGVRPLRDILKLPIFSSLIQCTLFCTSFFCLFVVSRTLIYSSWANFFSSPLLCTFIPFSSSRSYLFLRGSHSSFLLTV